MYSSSEIMSCLASVDDRFAYLLFNISLGNCNLIYLHGVVGYE